MPRIIAQLLFNGEERYGGGGDAALDGYSGPTEGIFYPGDIEAMDF